MRYLIPFIVEKDIFNQVLTVKKSFGELQFANTAEVLKHVGGINPDQEVISVADYRFYKNAGYKIIREDLKE